MVASMQTSSRNVKAMGEYINHLSPACLTHNIDFVGSKCVHVFTPTPAVSGMRFCNLQLQQQCTSASIVHVLYCTGTVWCLLASVGACNMPSTGKELHVRFNPDHSHLIPLDRLLQCAICRWHIEGEISHDWKKLAERKAKQLRKLSDTYKGQLDKVLPATAAFYRPQLLFLGLQLLLLRLQLLLQAGTAVLGCYFVIFTLH